VEIGEAEAWPLPSREPAGQALDAGRGATLDDQVQYRADARRARRDVDDGVGLDHADALAFLGSPELAELHGGEESRVGGPSLSSPEPARAWAALDAAPARDPESRREPG